MAEQTILIAEDDPDIRDGVRILLSGEGYHIIEAENGTRALEVFRPEVDLVILDIMMPGMSGLRVCEELRKLSTVPILFLTAKSQESDKLLGLTAGGDDYLPKPFSFAELSARVKALLRRYCVYQGKGQAPARAENLTLCSHGVKLALDCNRVWVDGEEIDLTETEYKILRLLMQSPQRIFPVQVIYEDVWQEPYFYTSNGTRALEVFRPEVDLVILDIMMPGMSGLRVCEELRKLSTVPILFLTAKSQESDKLLGLTAGGDDYLPKPFSFAELSARVKALLRRYCVYQGKGQAPARAENLTLCSHGVKLALDCNRVWVDGEEIDLTETEYKILRLLMQSPQRIFPVQVIYEDVWQEPYFYTSNGTVMVHIRNLRMKIEKDPQNPARLQTMWGKGYRFVPGEEKDHA